VRTEATGSSGWASAGSAESSSMRKIATLPPRRSALVTILAILLGDLVKLTKPGAGPCSLLGLGVYQFRHRRSQLYVCCKQTVQRGKPDGAFQ
jgi:hypothetical protein